MTSEQMRLLMELYMTGKLDEECIRIAMQLQVSAQVLARMKLQ